MALTVFLGGARSGKSAAALRRAGEFDGPVVFLATADGLDEEMRARIRRHQADRADLGWTTVEEPLELAAALTETSPYACVVVDCLSLWVANLLGRGDDEPAVVELAQTAARVACERPGPTIAVSNEVGLGVVPASALGRRYRDFLGRVNAVWVDAADEASLVVAGRLLRLTA